MLEKIKSLPTPLKLSQLLLLLMIFGYIFSFISGGLFTTYLMAFSVLIMGVITGILCLVLKKYQLAILDIVLGIAGILSYMLITYYIY